MTERAIGEGDTIAEALNNAMTSLGAVSAAELEWEFDRDHFKPSGAWTVRLTARMKSEQERAAARRVYDVADQAAEWVRVTLEKFGTGDAQVVAAVQGGKPVVNVSSQSDGSLLIGKDGKNLEALQVLLDAALAKTGVKGQVLVDIEGYRQRDRGDDRPPRRERDDRGPRRERDDRGPRRERSDRPPRAEGRGGNRDDRGPRRERGPRRDREDRGPRRDHDAARDERIVEDARKAAQRVLDSGESITLDEMNSYERRLVHQAVKEFEGLKSRSVGDGNVRMVEIARD
jgi:predicted RNA-binding protein Jag